MKEIIMKILLLLTLAAAGMFLLTTVIPSAKEVAQTKALEAFHQQAAERDLVNDVSERRKVMKQVGTAVAMHYYFISKGALDHVYKDIDPPVSAQLVSDAISSGEVGSLRDVTLKVIPGKFTGASNVTLALTEIHGTIITLYQDGHITQRLK